ncbi:DUF559 domain-containing protein [Nocardioides mangrovicus]|uniref:DUF559 domain-containing protein n=1 Tax=Nocardioides mangrovicus TaxID=2478913 RepID=A0A3L8P7F9_9ACTN|nr:DUF559 domain-containing protein [Nocardioides mangrovicus]RLV50877.1 DUF559 domain-containing protein [Nocardioides mangrovicus]
MFTSPARRALRLAEQQVGVVSRRQLYGLGVTRGEVRAHVRAQRWRRVGTQSVAVHLGPLPVEARRWAAVFEAGPRAMLDGLSALEAAGLQHVTSPLVRVSVPRGAKVRPGHGRRWGFDIRQTRRWSADDLEATGIPRTQPAVAAVRAALWARSAKEAALVLTTTVQQRLAVADDLGREALRIRRDRRRGLVLAVVMDLVGGVESLGELNVVRECRRRGIPPPSRQVVRRTRRGTYYLDLVWEEWKVVVEVDGIQHLWAGRVVDDALRQNAVTLTDATVLRLPLLGLRLEPDEFFAQIVDALRAAGCPGLGRLSA